MQPVTYKAPSAAPPVDSGMSDKELTWLVYALYGAGFLMGFLPWLVAILINYVKLKSVRGTWLGDHFFWQINTFWVSLLFSLAGLLLMPLAFIVERYEPAVVGVVILATCWIWTIYRLIKGCLYLNDNKSVYGD